MERLRNYKLDELLLFGENQMNLASLSLSQMVCVCVCLRTMERVMKLETQKSRNRTVSMQHTLLKNTRNHIERERERSNRGGAKFHWP